MTEKKLETVLHQFGLKHLHISDPAFAVPETPAVKRSSKTAAALPGCCEFATGIIYEGSENRTCSATSGHFCPATDFMNTQRIECCIFRKRKLEPEHL